MKKVFDDATNIAHETAAKAGYGNFTQMISKAVVKNFLIHSRKSMYLYHQKN